MKKVGSETVSNFSNTLDFSLYDSSVEFYLKNEVGNRIRLINQTTKQDLRNALLEGIREGEGIPDLRRRVQNVFETARTSRARTIARTETMTSVNRATFEGYKQTKGIVKKKEWISTRDSRVRPSHKHSNMLKTEAKLKGFFILGNGIRARFPQAPGLPPGEVINCRCTIAPIVDEKQGTLYDTEQKRYEYWKTMDNKAAGYTSAMKSSYINGFDEQEEYVLKVLEQEG